MARLLLAAVIFLASAVHISVAIRDAHPQHQKRSTPHETLSATALAAGAASRETELAASREPLLNLGALQLLSRGVASLFVDAEEVDGLMRLSGAGDHEPPHIGKVLVIMVIVALAVLACYLLLKRWLEHTLSEERFALIDDTLNAGACFAGIIICFCAYGMAQEYIMTMLYNGEKFPASAFLILTNRILIVIVSGVLLAIYREPLQFAAAKWTVIPGITVLISSWCQYSSLHYVTFPTQVVFKSAKIVPTMVVNTVLNRQFNDWKDYVAAVVITVCVVFFSLLTEDSSKGAANSTVVGIIMLIIFLLCDALSSNGEKRIYLNYPSFTNTQMMFGMGVVALVYSIVVVAIKPGFGAVFGFLHRNPVAWFHIWCLAVCSTAGQWTIFYVVKRHGPVPLSIMMTVRQIISIFVSALLYGHHIHVGAYFLAAGAFAATLARPVYRWLTTAPKAPKQEGTAAEKEPVKAESPAQGPEQGVAMTASAK